MMNLARLVRAVSRALTATVALAGAVSAQGTVSGRITAVGSGEGVAGARVIGLGTNSFAISAQDGRYVLKHMRPGSVEVQVLRVGYQAQKKTVQVAEGQVTADFALTAIVVKLDEVVTTANGPQRTVELAHTTTSLGDIGARQEQTPTSLNVGDLLVQKSPSVVVLGQGMVASASAIRIRGLTSLNQSNEPIVLVDGARVAITPIVPGQGVGGTQTSLLNSFAPDEIESIEIVKGPSAATMYGTNAANGVIMITTKKGRVGSAHWNWTAEQGLIKDNNDYPDSYAMWGRGPSSSTPIRCLLATMGPSTCTMDSLTSLNILKNKDLTPINTGRRNLYGMQVSGGTDVVRFYISGGVENTLGPLQMPHFSAQRLDSLLVKLRGEWKNPEAFQRENFRANVNATLSPTLEFGVNASFIKSDQRYPQSDASPVGIIAAARQSPGFAHPGLGYSNTGVLGEKLNGYNGWVPSEMFQDLSTQAIQREALSSNASWRQRPWLEHDIVGGLDFVTFTDFNVCRLNECPAYTNLRSGSNYSRTTGARLMDLKYSGLATWNYRPDMNLKTTFGTQYTYVETDASIALGIGLAPGAQNVGQSANRTNATNISATTGKTWGLFAQEQLSMRDRLFFTLGLRVDQNSAFGDDSRYALYPKAGVSWLMSDESFFPKYSWLDQFRGRLAYGVSGLQPGLVSARRTYQPITASIGGADQQGLIGSQIGNPDIKPERVSEIETGFDARMFGNRVNLEVTYFNKMTTDAIVNTPIAASSGSPSLFTTSNIGALKNTGFETVITTQLVDRKNLAWDLTIGASHGTSKVTDVGPTGTIVNGNTWQATGQPTSGLFFRPYTYNDLNGDGRIQTNEVTVDSVMRAFGYQVPRDLISIQNGLDLLSRRLRVTALLDYKGGHSVYDAGAAYLCAQYLSCPDESNPSASVADQARSVAARYGSTYAGVPFTTNAGYLSNGRFWRLREVSATLTLPTLVNKKLLRADRSSLNFGVRNLAVWSSYRGVDPESNFGAGDLQTDFMTAGPPTYYTLRLNLHY